MTIVSDDNGEGDDEGSDVATVSVNGGQMTIEGGDTLYVFQKE